MIVILYFSFLNNIFWFYLYMINNLYKGEKLELWWLLSIISIKISIIEKYNINIKIIKISIFSYLKLLLEKLLIIHG